MYFLKANDKISRRGTRSADLPCWAMIWVFLFVLCQGLTLLPFLNNTISDIPIFKMILSGNKIFIPILIILSS